MDHGTPDSMVDMGAAPQEQIERYAFGVFEVDLVSEELKRSGHRVRIQSQPFRVLVALLQKPGELVARQELQLKVWGSDVLVDFEHGLGNAIKKVRDAIGDSAENPRFIETIARRGYRFIAPVTPLGPAKPSLPLQGAVATVARVESVPVPSHPYARKQIRAATLIAGAFVLAIGGVLVVVGKTPPALARITQVTMDGGIYPQGFRSPETLSPLATSAGRIYSSSIRQSHIVLLESDVDSGATRQIPLPAVVQEPEIDDISPDGTKLLVRSHSGVELQEAEQPLWVVPTNGGSAFRVGDLLSHDATWSPDGTEILYATGNRLETIALAGGPSQLAATLPGRAFWLRWSPDGQVLRFTIVDLQKNGSSLWELRKGDSMARRLDFRLKDVDRLCCGVWTADGKAFVLQGAHDGSTDLWAFVGEALSGGRQITNGPLNYSAPAPGKGGQIYFQGADALAPVEQREFDPARNEFLPRTDFLQDAVRIFYAPDHQWVAWTDVSGHLWRARVDGSEKLQLTSGAMIVLNGSWPKEGKNLAVMARFPNEQNRLFWVSLTGGKPEPILGGAFRAVGDPSFSPDGQQLAFGGLPTLMGGDSSQPSSIHVLDLGTGNLFDLPGSKGLFSPRWSPDGKYIAALTLDQQTLMLYDLAQKTWKVVANMSASDPLWAPDAKSLYFYASVGSSRPIYRVGIPDLKTRNIYQPMCGQYNCILSGITPENHPLVRVVQNRANIYSMNLAHR